MLEIFDCDQGSDDWYECRRGIPTASKFMTIMAKGKDGGASITRRKYMYQLAAEIVTGAVHEGYRNADIERGHEMEPEARNMYALITDAEPTAVGFVRNGPKGCSPDSLVDKSGILEIKTKQPDLLIETLLRDVFPAEHKAQCQGALWVTEREWIDIAVYWPRLPLFIKRAYREEAYIAQIAEAVDAFNEELENVVDQVRRYGAPSLVPNEAMAGAK